VGIAVVPFLLPTVFVEHIGHAVAQGTSEGRFPIWKDALRLFAAYPMFGSGLHTFYPALQRYQTAGVTFAWPAAHNDYLQLLCELGIIGFVIPAALLLIVLRCTAVAANGSLTDARAVAVACLASLTAMLIHSLADFNLQVPANAMVFAWICGLGVGLYHNHQSKAKARTSFLRRSVLALGCIALLYSGASIAFNRYFRESPRAERLFCHFGVCDASAAAAALGKEYGDTRIPPGELLPFVSRDPADPSMWCDVGESMQRAGRHDLARYCFGRALTLAPRIPATLSRVADFDLTEGEQHEGLTRMAQALDDNPEFAPAIFGDYEQRGIGIDAVLESGLPNDPQISHLYLERQMSRESVLDAAKTWTWMINHGQVDDSVAARYVDFVVQKGRPEAAWKAWSAYVRNSDNRYQDENHIFNGGFERPVAPVVFDWTIRSLSDDVEALLDRQVYHSGSHALRLRFHGRTNVNYSGVYQTTFATAGTYRLEAYVRTENLTTDRGVGLRISSISGPKRLDVDTEQLIGTHSWERVSADIDVRDAGVLLVQVIRPASLMFDSLIAGTAWIDDVSLRHIG
jgi:hypothetical protein